MATVVGNPADGYNLISIEDNELLERGNFYFATLPEVIYYYSIFIETEDLRKAEEIVIKVRDIKLKDIIKEFTDKGIIEKIVYLETEVLSIDYKYVVNGKNIGTYLTLAEVATMVYYHLMGGGKEEDLNPLLMKKKIAQLEKELQICQNMIDYAPGGKGYEETAKNYAKRQASTKTSSIKSPARKAVTKTVKRKSPARKVAKK
jgi:hypothetical protein